MHRWGSSLFRALVATIASAVLLALALPARATNDAEWARQWGPQRIGVEHAFAAGVTGSGVRIGIVDTGVDLSHQDLAGKIVDNAACIDTGGDPGRCNRGGGQDSDGHGTHVAGIAAAVKDNGVGISGVAPGADLVVARVFKGLEAEGAKVSDVNAGIKWVVDNGAKVVNLSLGDAVPLQGELFGSPSLNDGIAYAWSRGAVAVLAAGNTNYFGLGASNYGNVDAVVVGATGRDDEPSSYSSPTGNAKWALVAPGGNSARGGQTAMIFSTIRSNQYGYKQGTSMAAPHVAGALALLMSQGKSNSEAVSRLLATVNSTVPCGGNSDTCRGRLDVACAVTGRCGGTPTPTGAGTTAGSPPADGGDASGGASTASGTSDTGGTATGSGGGSGAAAGTSGGGGSGGGVTTATGSTTKAGASGSPTPRAGSSGARIAGGAAGAGTPVAAAPGQAPVAGEAPPGAPGTPLVPGELDGDPEEIGLSFLPDEEGSKEDQPNMALVATAALLLVVAGSYGWRRRRAGR